MLFGVLFSVLNYLSLFFALLSFNQHEFWLVAFRFFFLFFFFSNMLLVVMSKRGKTDRLDSYQ